ncbi:MAG TPA: radical SAM protein, partial [Nitrospiria bacterium]|nr:radical SAM protein [Nitrospiria bacterium]
MAGMAAGGWAGFLTIEEVPMIEFSDKTIFHLPPLTRFVRDGIYFVVDGEAPNWIATDRSGAAILDLIDGRRSFGEIVREYGVLQSVESAKSWVHVHTFLHELLRRGLIATRAFRRADYTGRADYLKPARLREFWIHTNNSCNLTCTHCLVDSHPGGDPGISTAKLKGIIDQAAELGARRFYFTGGEPFVRNDIFELIEYVTHEKKAELIILTNATLFRGERLEGLKRQDRKRLKFQVSLDGCGPATNDPIRGQGTFDEIAAGLDVLSGLGFDTSLTAVVTGTNIKDMGGLPDLAKKHGATSIHLMWLHRRGRALEAFEGLFPSNDDLLRLVRRMKRRSDELGIVFDNLESLKLRANGQPGVKFDLGNACWDSLCLYSDGHLYPSASFAGYAPLDIGNAGEHSVKALWLESPVTRRFRAASLVRK